MTASGKRPPGPRDVGAPSPAHAEDEELERIARMDDDELDHHLADSGVDVADLDAQVDSIREQVVSSRIGAPAFARVDRDEENLPLTVGRFGLLGKVIVLCVVIAVAVGGGTALASLLR
jgi:hypothetical protein